MLIWVEYEEKKNKKKKKKKQKKKKKKTFITSGHEDIKLFYRMSKMRLFGNICFSISWTDSTKANKNIFKGR